MAIYKEIKKKYHNNEEQLIRTSHNIRRIEKKNRRETGKKREIQNVREEESQFIFFIQA